MRSAINGVSVKIKCSFYSDPKYSISKGCVIALVIMATGIEPVARYDTTPWVISFIEVNLAKLHVSPALSDVGTAGVTADQVIE